ncbi:MAG: DUF2490 domain-containing protein [Porphyrobacter sp.]|nr:DUF2490 domain-containing protein [Porphyrobacter sp.]
MKRTTGFSALRSGAPMLVGWAFIASPAQATPEDTQLWFVVSAAVPLDQGIVANLEASPRLRQGADQLLTRANVDVRLSEAVSVGAGGAYVEFAGGYELRPHQQVTISAGPLAFRTRVEQRFFDGAPRTEWRLRQRVAASLPLSGRTALTGSAEVLYIARPQHPAEEARVDSWRAIAGVQQRLSPHLVAGLNYLLLLSPREGAPDRLSHVPQVTLTFRP